MRVESVTIGGCRPDEKPFIVIHYEDGTTVTKPLDGSPDAEAFLAQAFGTDEPQGEN